MTSNTSGSCRSTRERDERRLCAVRRLADQLEQLLRARGRSNSEALRARYADQLSRLSRTQQQRMMAGHPGLPPPRRLRKEEVGPKGGDAGRPRLASVVVRPIEKKGEKGEPLPGRLESVAGRSEGGPSRTERGGARGRRSPRKALPASRSAGVSARAEPSTGDGTRGSARSGEAVDRAGSGGHEEERRSGEEGKKRPAEGARRASRRAEPNAEGSEMAGRRRGQRRSEGGKERGPGRSGAVSPAGGPAGAPRDHRRGRGPPVRGRRGG
ncbi:hypothetical protein GPALN_016316 [Globodera pallida]|nr:hypothetical protein GPALN_016316 [Globodera pallida]